MARLIYAQREKPMVGKKTESIAYCPLKIECEESNARKHPGKIAGNDS